MISIEKCLRLPCTQNVFLYDTYKNTLKPTNGLIEVVHKHSAKSRTTLRLSSDPNAVTLYTLTANEMIDKQRINR